MLNTIIWVVAVIAALVIGFILGVAYRKKVAEAEIAGAEEEITENPMYLILNLARVLAYLKEKRILSKQEGGIWGLENLPEEYRPLIAAALREYGDGADVSYDPDLARRYAAYILRQIG